MVWKSGNGPWPVQQPRPAQSGEQQPRSREPHGAWQPCLCPGHVPSLPPLGAVAVSLPLLRARMDSWLSPFRLEQPKSLTWCKKSRCHLPMGLTFLCPANPREQLERAGMGWPCTWLILFSILWCWSRKVWKTAGCGGQAEPPTSTCPGITGSDSPGVGA